MIDSHDLATYQAAIAEHGGIRAAGRALGIPESTIRTRMKKGFGELMAEETTPFVFTSYRQPRPVIYEPYPDRTRHFILTLAQDASQVHESFWQCLLAYAEWLGDCEIFAGGCTYNKALFEDHDNRSAKVAYHPLVDPFITHDRIRIGDEVDFCGEMNTLVTATTPLSGFATYTKARWGIFPHTKVQLESIATMKHERAKLVMTTGAVTLPNYVRKKAGIKAQFHHICGAIIVDLHPDGSTYCRQLLATDLEDGSFYDLDRRVSPGGVTDGHRVEAIVYGDIHREKLDPDLAMATWGFDVQTDSLYPDYTDILPITLVDYLAPRNQFFHDLSDFTERNHHSISDPHFRFKRHVKKRQSNTADNVAASLALSGRFLGATLRHDCQSYVVESNHHSALMKWLKTADYRADPENALFFLKSETWNYEQMEAGIENPAIYEHVLRLAGAPDAIRFLDEDESLVIKGIQCGMHGHLGPNGTRGSLMALSKVGGKAITGHSHSPAIRDGLYVAGVSGKLDMAYNKGPSSWAHAHVVIYPNGKRAILNYHNGRFFA